MRRGFGALESSSFSHGLTTCCKHNYNSMIVPQERDSGVHENLPLHVCDELTRNAQMILQMLSFGAYREVLAMVRDNNQFL